MAQIIDVYTDDDLQYQYFRVSSWHLKFQVKAQSDAFLAITSGPHTTFPMFEFIICGWRNTKSAIKKNLQTPFVKETNTHGYLSPREYRSFWLKWGNKKVEVGRNGETIPFMSYTDPDDFALNYVGVSTGWGATGSWKLEVSPLILKPIKYEKFEDGCLRWVHKPSQLPQDALIGGFENETIYIARAVHQDKECFGKYIPSKRKAYVIWNAQEVEKSECQILCGYNAIWVKTATNKIPRNAFIAHTTAVRDQELYF